MSFNDEIMMKEIDFYINDTDKGCGKKSRLARSYLIAFLVLISDYISNPIAQSLKSICQHSHIFVSTGGTLLSLTSIKNLQVDISDRLFFTLTEIAADPVNFDSICPPL